MTMTFKKKVLQNVYVCFPHYNTWNYVTWPSSDPIRYIWFIHAEFNQTETTSSLLLDVLPIQQTGQVQFLQ